MKEINGGVTSAKGFMAAGVEAAIKYQNRKDMAMVYSKVPCQVAGTFTSNVVKAACVLWDKEIVDHSAYGQAVVVNSGIANACTGQQGYDCCRKTAQAAAKALQIPEESVSDIRLHRAGNCRSAFRHQLTQRHAVDHAVDRAVDLREHRP